MRALLLSAALLAITLAGCTTSTTDDNTIECTGIPDGEPGMGMDDATIPALDDAGCYIIEMGGTHGLNFAYARAEVPAGATIIWKNLGGSHNVVSGSEGNDAGVWPATTLGTGDAIVTLPDDLMGEQSYYCAPHWAAGMQAVLVIGEPDAMTEEGADGGMEDSTETDTSTN